MSHNWKYYAKKVKRSDAQGSKTIASYFRTAYTQGSINSQTETSTSQSETSIEPESLTLSPQKQLLHKTPRAPEDETQASAPETEIIKSPAPNCKEFSSVHDGRQFIEGKYQSRFNWLYYSSIHNGFMCKFCELFAAKFDTSTPYVTCGAILGDHPSRRLESHNDSEKHKASIEKYSQFNSSPNVSKMLQGHATECENRMTERNRKYIKQLFKTCVFVVKKNWAIKNIADLIRFMGETCGGEIGQVIQQESVTYLSSTSITEILTLLSNHIERILLTELRAAGKFTVLADESTDTSNRTQFSVFARYVKKGHGPVEQYLGLINVDRTTSAALMEELQAFLIGKGLDMGRIRFVGFDGCNTMSGERKGLQRRIRNISPLSIYINCRNHRLALCFVHIMKRWGILEDVDALLLAIWKMLHFSPQKAAVFKNMQDLYGQKPVKIVRAAATRWLSHLKACERFIDRYETLIDTMDSIVSSTRNPEVQGIRDTMLRKDLTATALLLADILQPVNILSLYLQEDCGTFTELPVKVKCCTDHLNVIIQQYQQNTYEGLKYSKCQELFDVIDDRTALGRRMRGGQAHNITPEDYLRDHGMPILYSLIGEIEDALGSPDLVLSAFGLLEPSRLPEDVADIHNYGMNDARILADFYGTEKVDTFEGHRTVVPPDLGNADLIYYQLLDFRRPMFMYKAQGYDSVTKLYKLFSSEPATARAFPLLEELLKLALLIPQSTAVVERGFSLMNNICTDTRSLSQGSLDSLIRIKSFKDLSNEDFEALLESFKESRDRDMKL